MIPGWPTISYCYSRNAITLHRNSGGYYFDQAVNFWRIVRRVLSFSTRFPRDSHIARGYVVGSLLCSFDENSDVITYKVTLFSVYGYRLLRRYPSYYGRESRIENKRRNIWIISLVVFGRRLVPLLNGTIGRNRGRIARKQRVQRIPLPRNCKKKSCQKLSSTSALQLYIGPVYFYARRKRPVINFPKQKARRNRVPSSFHEMEE